MKQDYKATQVSLTEYKKAPDYGAFLYRIRLEVDDVHLMPSSLYHSITLQVIISSNTLLIRHDRKSIPCISLSFRASVYLSEQREES